MKNKPKVLRSIQVAEPGKDGVFIHVKGLIQFLLGSRQELVYFYSSKRGCAQLDELLAELSKEGVETRDLKVGNAPCPRDLTAMAGLLWAIHKFRPQIVHGHSSKAGALARLASLLVGGVRCVYTPHAYYSMAQKPTGWRILYWWIEQLLADGGTTINISRSEERFAVEQLGLAGYRRTVAPNPVASLKRFSVPSSDDKRELRRAFSLPEDAFVIGIAARVSEQKDLDTFYRAAAVLAGRRRDVWFFHLGGDGERRYRRFAEEKGFADRVRWLDFQQDPSSFYKTLDLFALTSKFEAGWPFVMLEALATGLPMISTEFIGIDAHPVETLSAFQRVPVGDSAELAEKMEHAIENRRNGADCANNHRAVVERTFDSEACYGKVLELYRRESAEFEGIRI